MVEWLGRLREVLDRDPACVLVTVVDVRGSTPRESGAKMVVTATDTIGSIGGGNLEYESIGNARALLGAAREDRSPRLLAFALGARLGQCCGGHARLLLEPMTGAQPWLAACEEGAAGGERGVLVTVVDDRSSGTASRAGTKLYVTARDVRGVLAPRRNLSHVVASARDVLRAAERDGSATPRLEPAAPERPLTVLYEPLSEARPRLWLFGAGHVGKALVAVLADSPCRIVWVDGRAEQFPRTIPGNVEARFTEMPEYCVDEAVASDSFLVMTHSHALDLRLVERVLRRPDFRFLGLIGSGTKRRRFEGQLRRRGVDPSRLVCPIGVSGIAGKHPRSIAVAVAAQLMRVWEHRARPGVDIDRDRSQHDAVPPVPPVGAR